MSAKKNATLVFRKALVTGANSGIGAAVCTLLAKKGIPLIVSGRDQIRLNALVKELQASILIESIPADLSSASDRDKLIDAIHRHSPDLIINNAGFGLYGEALSYETKDQAQITEVNATALLELTLESARTMMTNGQKGVVLNVSSSAGELVFPNFAVYAASKAFVTQLSQSLDYEMRPRGIRILASCPGMVATAFRKRASGIAEAPNDRNSMSADYAALEIWKQIEKGRQVHFFDWKTRIGVFIAKHLLPAAWVSYFLAKMINSYISPRMPIPIYKDDA